MNPHTHQWLTPTGVKLLTEKHLQRYEMMLQKHKEKVGIGLQVRPDEVRTLLDIWKEIQNKNYDLTKLTFEERAELEDAIEDEQFPPPIN